MTDTRTPLEYERVPEVPRARINLDLAAKQSVNADLAIAAMRQADSVLAATDHMTRLFDKLIDSGNVYPRPVMFADTTAAAPGVTKREAINGLAPGLYELTRIFAYGGEGATGTATLTLALAGGLPPIPIAVIAGTPANIGMGLPIEVPQAVSLNITGGTGLWVMVLVLSRLDVLT